MTVTTTRADDTGPDIGPADRPDGGDLIGTAIGNYVIDELIGGGGMGDIYRASRSDDQFERQVAIKLIKRGLDSDDVIRRFRAERQILASLDHPNIAAVFDGGIHDDGRPYLVMELVDGAVPIDTYCERKELALERRLELFSVVCSAVQTAHQNLVVHRDLKPSNIVVSAAGDIKLLDFGVAKLIDPTQDEELTRTGLAPMTAICASPEQVLGKPVTTASDVYALGVLLYRLVADRPPYDLAGKSLADQVELISTQQPPTPSDVVREERGVGHARAVRGDLDNIVRMAMRKDPAERYPSVAALADDVERFLRHEPVRARRETPLYLMRKFVRRNRLGVAAAVVVLLSLAGGVVATAWQARVARDERDRAQVEARRAERAKGLIVDLFESAGPEQSLGAANTPVHELVERGEAKLRAGLADDPAMLAEMLLVLGRVYNELGLLERGRSTIKSSLELRRQQFGDRSLEVAESLHELAIAERYLSESQVSAEYARKALELRTELLGRRHPQTAEVMRSLATSVSGRDADEADKLYAEALSIEEEVLGKSDIAVAKTLTARGTVRHYAADYEGSERDLTRALAILTELGEDELTLARIRNSLAVTRQQLGLEGVSEEFYRSLISVYKKWLGEKHPSIVTPMINLGGFYYDRGDNNAALEQFREALDISRSTNGEAHPRSALILSNIGVVSSVAGYHAEAEKALRAALAIRRQTLQPGHSSIAHVELNLGVALMRAGKTDEAESLLRSALAGSTGRHARRASATSHTLALLALHRGDLDEARTLLERALKLVENVAPTPSDIKMHTTAVAVWLADGDVKRALEHAQRATELAKKRVDTHWEVAFAAAHLAAARIASGGGAEARAELERARSTLRDLLGENHWSLDYVSRVATSAERAAKTARRPEPER